MRGRHAGGACALQDAADPAKAGAAAAAPDQAVQPDPEIVASLTAMGFSENGSKRAAVATQARANLLQAICSL